MKKFIAHVASISMVLLCFLLMIVSFQLRTVGDLLALIVSIGGVAVWLVVADRVRHMG